MSEQRDYSTLPAKVHLDETITSVEPDAVPDPEGVRNGDQHRALRDD